MFPRRRWRPLIAKSLPGSGNASLYNAADFLVALYLILDKEPLVPPKSEKTNKSPGCYKKGVLVKRELKRSCPTNKENDVTETGSTVQQFAEFPYGGEISRSRLGSFYDSHVSRTSSGYSYRRTSENCRMGGEKPKRLIWKIHLKR